MLHQMHSLVKKRKQLLSGSKIDLVTTHWRLTTMLQKANGGLLVKIQKQDLWEIPRRPYC